MTVTHPQRLDATALMARLPPVRGRLTRMAPLNKITWFRVGGPAEILFKPADRDDLGAFLGACPDDIPITVLGVASNMLIRDGGVPGVVIRLGRDFAGITAEGNRIRAGAAAMDANVARVARQADLEGLEFFSGIPGTIGGALRMNGGAYGGETREVLIEATALSRAGATVRYTPRGLSMGYRHSDLPCGSVFIQALFQARHGDGAVIAERMAAIAKSRGDTQPVRSRTGGSTFANPDGHKAWQLIDQAGCRGLTVGGAMMSEMHCNFMINTGTATAADLENLGETVRHRVAGHSGIELRWEIRRIGIPLPGPGASR